MARKQSKKRVLPSGGTTPEEKKKAQDAVHQTLTYISHRGGTTLDIVGMELVVGDDEWRIAPGIDITGLSCKVIAGDVPTCCPDQDPVLPPHLLRDVEAAVRNHYTERKPDRDGKLQIVQPVRCHFPSEATIHWVGHRAGVRSRCKCHPTAPYAAPFDKERWAAVVSQKRSRFDFDEDTRSISFDGRQLGGSLSQHVFRFFRAIALAHPNAIDYRTICRQEGLKGKNQTRDLKDRLPIPLRNLLQSGRNGYALELPPENRQ